MLTLVPAYGRDYRSAKDARTAWYADQDWRISNFHSPDDGRYINRPQTKPGERFLLRFKRLTLTCVVGAEAPKPRAPRAAPRAKVRCAQ